MYVACTTRIGERPARASIPRVPVMQEPVSMDALMARPSRRTGVFRRAVRREISRLHDRRRLLAMALLILVGGVIGAGMIARGDPAGADARAYWAGVRIWLNGGDPYHPTGPFLP
jgi:hypothetical protein